MSAERTLVSPMKWQVKFLAYTSKTVWWSNLISENSTIRTQCSIGISYSLINWTLYRNPWYARLSAVTSLLMAAEFSIFGTLESCWFGCDPNVAGAGWRKASGNRSRPLGCRGTSSVSDSVSPSSDVVLISEGLKSTNLLMRLFPFACLYMPLSCPGIISRIFARYLMNIIQFASTVTLNFKQHLKPTSHRPGCNGLLRRVHS